MKKKINPATGKLEYRLNHEEAAEFVYMTIGELKYRYTKQCTMHESSIPKRTYLHGIAGFWMSLEATDLSSEDIEIFRNAVESI